MVTGFWKRIILLNLKQKGSCKLVGRVISKAPGGKLRRPNHTACSYERVQDKIRQQNTTKDVRFIDFRNINILEQNQQA